MIWARSRHLWSDCLALSITWPPSHVSKFMFEKKNEPFCYLSHPEVFFKHQSWAFPGSNPSCALWPRQPSLPIKQISKSLSLHFWSPFSTLEPSVQGCGAGKMDKWRYMETTHWHIPAKTVGWLCSTNCNIWCGDILSVESRPGNVDVD